MRFGDEKVAIITGASQGIGAGLVDAYRKHGYRVVANSRAIAVSPHPEVATVAGDIADSATADRLVSEALARFGRIDTLVNNAGIFVAKPFTLYTPEDYARVTSVNVLGFFHVTQGVITRMLEQGTGGHIINITTTLVEQPCAAIPAALTALTKGGLASVTKSLAIEYAADGIRVNAISPGVIDTPLHAGVDAPTAYAGMHPQNRIGAVSDIVHGALYLETAHFVTGEILHIDGGQHAGH
ncbi:SDR family NAD(P)-dependent oxidoreductase [Mycobacterium sp. 852002-51057_SCH5723018]|uniref:SDR family NAD(P)-dependent oxidoreductase n=1 Tax=Mycobacterium sp. 852002-51057_SCH5723018 TaxID=1834094 RepID=UPI0007FF200F|nr:SDR family oxidoreductase [Mycobacterium sp. 852002-51057_SCH5723018]OBG29514.1 3-oxoacyl-ACP reductase [Mycobacterium sp. 852002-51057_SCH5723018]